MERDKDVVGRYADNSRRAREGKDAPQRPEVKKITSAQRRKKPLGRKFADMIGGGESRGVWSGLARETMIPELKVILLENFFAGVERMILGESRGRRGGARGSSRGRERYADRYSGGRERARPDTHNRSSYDIGEVIVDTRVEAEEVVDTMFSIISEYEVATVADLFQMTDIETNYMDRKWGWEDLRPCDIIRLKDGSYLIDVPRPIELA